MGREARVLMVAAVLCSLFLGCTSPTPSSSTPRRGTDAAAVTAPPRVTRITIAIAGDPPTLNNEVNSAGAAGGIPGGEELERLVAAGLSMEDERKALRPQLARALPSTENGQWRLLPDGRMETLWPLRPGAQWHDGAPLTSTDFVFSGLVGQDRDVAIRRDPAFDYVESVEAPDPQTVLVRWHRPFINADALFSRTVLPRHLLERSFAEDRAGFTQLHYWTQEFVGSGPYRVRDWVGGSHAVLQAFDHYVLGRPKIDEIEVRFIPDANTMAANILAGTVDLTMGRGISLEQGVQLRDQWRDGTMVVSLTENWIAAFPQLLNPTPAVLGNAPFRRALAHAADRQELADSLVGGLVPPAHTYLNPAEALYREVEPSLVRYDFDPRRAIQLVEALGYQRGADGFFRDAAGQRLAVEIRVVGGDINHKATFALADYWQRAGIDASTLPIPPQRAREVEWRANFPGYEVAQQPADLSAGALRRFHGAEASLPDNNYRGNNRTRYMNPEFDALLDRYYVTVPRAERVQLIAQIMRHMTEQAIVLGLLYNAQATMMANRLRHAPPRTSWNVYEWEVVA